MKVRLRTLKPQLSSVTRAIAPAIRHNADWRAWYSTKRWRELRIATFRRDGFQCALCYVIEGRSANLVCDHIEPHGGMIELFYDPDNLQTLCKPCHDSIKQRHENARRREGG